MTNQHRATPEQWACVEEWGTEDMDNTTSCILELRDRVAAMERLGTNLVELYEDFDPAATKSLRAAILELAKTVAEVGHRVEALEAQYETQRQATLAWGKDVDNYGRWIDDHLKRIMALEAAKQASPGAVPGESLVERVAGAMHPESFSPGETWDTEARAAIREVAAWLRTDQPLVAGNAAALASLLEQEACQ